MTERGGGRSVSVLTLVSGREAHLRNLVRGLAGSRLAPAELVVAAMDGRQPALPEVGFPIRVIDASAEHQLPLAAARNAAIRAAREESIVLLDVDCIPSAGLVEAYTQALGGFEGLVMGGVRYLRPGSARERWTDPDLRAASDPHPARPEPAGGTTPTDHYELFWSLSFGTRRSTLMHTLGGFDESFSGYGAEDTDLGFTARDRGVPLAWLGGAVCFHQHHPSSERSERHVAAIVTNAQRFYDKWGEWPMEGWLRELAEIGAIDWSPAGDAIALTGSRTG